jgi:hypothetical protein
VTNPAANLPRLPGTAGTPPPGYPPDSRYVQTDSITRTLDDGRTVTYLRRRFIPDTTDLPTLAFHDMSAVDRLDNVAGTYYGDSQLWWRIADANALSDPDELLVAGRRVRITQAPGSGGVPL